MSTHLTPRQSSVTCMDTEEWEIIPDEGFLEILHDDGESKIYSRKCTSSNLDRTVFLTNYFVCPSNPIPLPLTVHLLEPQIPTSSDQSITERDPVSQVCFKKMNETEFVDIKVDPSKATTSSCRGGVVQFQDPKVDDAIDSEEVGLDLNIEDGLNIWKWSITGIGAVCSFGVAVATVYGIIILSSREHKHPVQLQIHTDDKWMKHGNKFRGRIPGVRIKKARITFGGRYKEALQY